MKLSHDNITFVIVTFKSEKIINECLDTLPSESKKLVIENSNNLYLKTDLEKRYQNLEVIINKNSGFGASNNLGIKKSSTQFVYIINPDVKFKKDTFTNLIESSKLVDDFAVISPVHSEFQYPNYIIRKKYVEFNENIIEVDDIDGFSMLINKSNFKNDEYFDENFFLYLENNDLCLRLKKDNKRLFVIKNSFIDHKGGSSSDPDFSELQYLKNWHWMWSKFYYHKKHYGYIYGFLKISKNLFSALIKYIIYSLIMNKNKKNFYKSRLNGCVNGLLLRKSWYRLNI